MNVYKNFICNSPKLETTQLFLNECMVKLVNHTWATPQQLKGMRY